MTTAVAETDAVETKTDSKRLRGFVERYVPHKGYGFVSVPGEGSKQWHFHLNSLRTGTPKRSIARGVVVEFTPRPCPAEGKCDKASDIVVVG